MGLHDRLKTPNGSGSVTAEQLLTGSQPRETASHPAAHDPYVAFQDHEVARGAVRTE